MTSAVPETLTFGCRLNIAESEVMQRYALAAGLKDTVIINTCAVTAEAERQAGQAIRRLKRERPGARIIVTGCASHIDPHKFQNMPEVDHLISNDIKLRVESYRAISGKSLSKVTPSSVSPLADKQRAFVQVQNGCDHRCTFCIIPFGRGASRSLTIESITQEVKNRIAEGFNEIVLTGVDITSYGSDLSDRPTLGSMIRQLLFHVPQLPRLRLSSLDPAAIDEDLWHLIANEPRLMPHLHLSLQSGDDLILKRMKRRHSRKDVYDLCERARKLRPDIVFGADVIAGFPTESDAMFENTYELAEQCGLTWLHVFPYSARKGTPASKMPQVHGSLRASRAERLRSFSENAAQSHYQAMIGKTLTVLVENNNIGCTPHFAKVRVKGTPFVGSLLDVTCTKLEDKRVVAEMANVL